MKESIADILKSEGYVSEVCCRRQSCTKNIKLKLKYQGKKSVIEGLKPRQHARVCAVMSVRRKFRACAAAGRFDCLHLARRDDRHAGPQEKYRRRIALLHLVTYFSEYLTLCHELENNRSPFPPKVKVEVKGQQVSVEGPKGKLELGIAPPHQL